MRNAPRKREQTTKGLARAPLNELSPCHRSHRRPGAICQRPLGEI